MAFMSSRNPLTGEVEPVNPSDVMLSPMMAVGPALKVVNGINTATRAARAARVGDAAPGGIAQSFQDEIYKRYLAKFFGGATAPTPLSTAARGMTKPAADIAAKKGYLPTGQKLAGLLPAWMVGGSASDIELPPESGIRDPRLPAPGVLDNIQMSRAMLNRMLKRK